jgi:carbamoyl-phosphate synthase large subunit
MGIKIGVTGTGSLIGQAIIKSIVRSDHKSEYVLIGLDYFACTVGSLWCQKNFILPDLLKLDQEEEWLSKIKQIIRAEDIRILFAGVDFELPILAKYKIEVETETNCRVVISSEEVIKIGNDKYYTYQFLKANELNYPLTYLPEECDFDSLLYPVIIKPRVGARSIGVQQVSNIHELKKALEKVKSPIIQELVGDDSSEYTCGIISFNGNLQRSIALNRTLKDGNTFISEFRHEYPKAIYLYLGKIANKLRPFGACNIQLRLDKNGTPKLFEINPRHSGTTYIRSLFGYNEVLFILKYLLEGIEIPFNLKEGKVIRYFEEALVSDFAQKNENNFNNWN